MAHRTDLGTVLIHNDVIASIASHAALEVPGVAGLWYGRLSSLRSLFLHRGVRVEIRDQDVRLWVDIIAEYGSNLPHVASQVQERIREMIEQMTSLMASEIHVHIHHVKVKKS